MDQDLCEIENDTPLLIDDSETDSNHESLFVDETVDSNVCDTETEASNKEKHRTIPNLLDKAYSIDDTVLAVPLEPIPVRASNTKLDEKTTSSNEDSISEDDFVVIESTSSVNEIEETLGFDLGVSKGYDQDMPDQVKIDEMAGDDDTLLNNNGNVNDSLGMNGESKLISPIENKCDNIPCTSILRRFSCFDNSDNVPETDIPKNRVSFLDKVVESYREPEIVTPWKIEKEISAVKIMEVYVNSCKKNNTIQLDSIKEQLMEIKNNTNHSAILNLSSINIKFEVNETLEDILQVANFNTLILSDCKFTPATITEFLNMLEFYESVCHIELQMKFDDDETWKCFCNACSNIKVLESISFKSMVINDIYMRFLMQTVKVNKNITILKFDGCGLVKLPNFYLIENLMANDTLRELYLSSTGLYTREADVLGRFLQINGCLKVLDISNNFIGDRGLEVLARGLCKQVLPGVGLSVLVVFNNQITEKSGPCISTIIKECKNLHTLNIGFNNLTDEVLISISNSLQYTSSLEGLGLQCTLLTCKGIQVLAEALQNNSSLRKINLKGNKAIQLSGVEKLCAALAGTKINKIELDEFNRTCNNPDSYKEMVKQIIEICTINKGRENCDDEIINISKTISRKVSLSCDLKSVDMSASSLMSGANLSPIVSPASSPAPKSRFSISRVSDSSLNTSSVKPKNRFKVTRVLPSPEEEELPGKFANVRSSVSSNDSMDSLTTLPLDTDSDNEH